MYEHQTRRATADVDERSTRPNQHVNALPYARGCSKPYQISGQSQIDYLQKVTRSICKPNGLSRREGEDIAVALTYCRVPNEYASLLTAQRSVGLSVC